MVFPEIVTLGSVLSSSTDSTDATEVKCELYWFIVEEEENSLQMCSALGNSTAFPCSRRCSELARASKDAGWKMRKLAQSINKSVKLRLHRMSERKACQVLARSITPPTPRPAAL